MEKSQTAQEEESKQKQKKAKEGKPGGERKRPEVLPPRLGDQELLKSLVSLKAITIYGAARSLGVNSSVAKGVLSSLESKGLLTRVGGYSGHYVWAVAS